MGQQYGANALPTIKMTKADGSEVHGFVGYKPLAGVLAEMEKARQMAGQ